MGCCASTGQAAGEVVDQKYQEHKEEQIAKRVKKLGTLDEEALNLKAKLRSLDGAVDRLGAMHRTMSGVKNDTLHLPSLHIWSQHTPCIGGPTAPKALHNAAAHINELSTLLVELRTLVFKQYAQDLLDCKAPIRAGIDAINSYIEAEEALSQKMAKLEKAGHPPSAAPAPAPAEGEAPAEEAPSSADTAAADKVSKLQADVDAAAKDAATAKENAMRIAGESHTKVSTEQLKSATEKMMEGRLKYVNLVAKLLSEPSTERIFDNYRPTSSLSGISDGLTVASKAFDFKVDLFQKDSTAHSAEVTTFMETIKQADLEAELAKKQVVNFTKNLATIFTSDQLQEAFTQLAETVEDDATKTLLAEVPPAPGQQAEFVSAANAACTDFQLCIENFRAILLARMNDAKVPVAQAIVQLASKRNDQIVADCVFCPNGLLERLNSWEDTRAVVIQDEHLLRWD
mmetsp:Transcript_20373/g.44222  ORF Transcript_20373/g.44222 Transcript_20373/m.44222 type:complete len:457 (+) Transcript_20373:130-1500(+)